MGRSAGVDDLERIHVGPESAGSEPVRRRAGGAVGRVHVPGAGELRVKGREVVPPGYRIVMATPGGGGLGDLRRRARDRVREDVLHG